MRVKGFFIVSLCLVIVFISSAFAQEPVHWDIVRKIMEEGFQRSQVMENASYLTDVFGPRLAGSPSYRAAAEWAKKRLDEYGLSNAKLEPYGEFGVSWVNEFTSVHMVTPRYMPVIAYPQSWSAGTNGTVRGPVVYINFDEITSETDLEPYRRKLLNAVVFSRPKQEITPHFSPIAVRLTEEQLEEMAKIPIGPRVRERREREPRSVTLPKQQIIDFVFSEGASAIASPDGREDFGTVVVNEVAGNPWEKNTSDLPTELVIAAEHYNRIMRILEKGIPVEMLLDVKVTYIEDDPTDYNVIAEIPGADPVLRDEVVMLGGHLDANSSGTGATDNAAGAVVAIEAARILKAIGIEPRRTIRVALWGAEESGLIGSRKYVLNHFGDPDTQKYKAEHTQLSGYFNLDTGTGKIRGIYLQENEAVRPIFTEWIKPFHSLGMKHLIPRRTGGTDHLAFTAVGLPGFTFIQDNIEYFNRNYHTNMDVYDRLIPEDLMQASVIMASFVYHTAMRDEMLPRIPPPEDRRR